MCMRPKTYTQLVYAADFPGGTELKITEVQSVKYCSSGGPDVCVMMQILHIAALLLG